MFIWKLNKIDQVVKPKQRFDGKIQEYDIWKTIELQEDKMVYGFKDRKKVVLWFMSL